MSSPGSSTWSPMFTPLMSPEIYGEAIAKAKQIITPQKSAS